MSLATTGNGKIQVKVSHVSETTGKHHHFPVGSSPRSAVHGLPRVHVSDVKFNMDE